MKIVNPEHSIKADCVALKSFVSFRKPKVKSIKANVSR